MTKFIQDILKDKAGNYSLREVIIALSFVLVSISWIAQLGFNISTPEYMFYAIVSLIAAGCFGYSLERKTNTNN